MYGEVWEALCCGFGARSGWSMSHESLASVLAVVWLAYGSRSPRLERTDFAVPWSSFITVLRAAPSLNGFLNPADLNKHCSWSLEFTRTLFATEIFLVAVCHSNVQSQKSMLTTLNTNLKPLSVVQLLASRLVSGPVSAPRMGLLVGVDVLCACMLPIMRCLIYPVWFLWSRTETLKALMEQSEYGILQPCDFIP